MCRSTDMHCVDRDKINIRAFCVRLNLPNQQGLLPDSLTLVYLPRITGSALDVDGCEIRPDSPAFVTLHRLVSSGFGEGGDAEVAAVAYASKERVRASEGLRYEVCLGDVKLLNGVFRRDEDEGWKMGCRCLLEEEMVGVKVVEAEVSVAAEGRVAVCETVQMVVRRRRRRRNVMGLEEIPEAKEEECYCTCGGGAAEDSGGDGETEREDLLGVGWAVDVGLWVMCLGVGLLVSKASSRRLRRRIFS